MATRNLRVVKRTPSVLAVSEKYNAEFTVSEVEIKTAFDAQP
ncbi:MAG: hypothetical protein WBW84_10880 [Acidobacteriaceae bacterium]